MSPAEKPRQHYGVTLLILFCAAMAYALAQTMVAPALPEMQHHFGTNTTTVTFVLTGFLLTSSIATPIMGRLGDIYGKERLLVVVLALFALGSVVAALAPSIWVLIAGRAIQGMGGAVFPISFGIIRDEFPREKVATGIGLISGTFGIGGGIGIVSSGVLVDNLGISSIFWLSAIVTIAAVVAAYLFVPESPVKAPARIDWVGGILLSAALTSLLVGVSEGNSWGWESAPFLGLLALATILFVFWVRYELSEREPLVDIRMLQNRAVWATNLTGFLVGFSMFGSFVLIPQLVQVPASTGFGFGATVTQAGLYMLPSSFAMLVAAPLAGWLGGRVGSRVPLIIGTAALTFSLGFLAVAHAEPWQIYVSSFTTGIGISFAFASMSNLIVDAVEQTKVGVATGINAITRTIGGSIGGQIVASVIVANTAASGLPMGSAFTTSFWIASVAALAAFVAALSVPVRRRTTAARQGARGQTVAAAGGS